MTEKNNYTHVKHGFEPLYDSSSNILILGTMPSVKSREQNFYYGHPGNRFWKLLAAIFSDNIPRTIDEKKAFLHRHHIALWDVISECDIIGSSDSSIKNVVPADISVILNCADIRCIYANGTKAYDLYMKYLYGMTNREIVKLPSTSPANAAFKMDRLINFWSIIL